MIVAIVGTQTDTSVVTESLASTGLYQAGEVAGAQASLLAADMTQGQFPLATG
jgi:hypothetical protein